MDNYALAAAVSAFSWQRVFIWTSEELAVRNQPCPTPRVGYVGTPCLAVLKLTHFRRYVYSLVNQ